MELKTTLEEQESVRSFFHRYTGLNPMTLNFCDDFDTLKIEVVRFRSHARKLEQSLEAEQRCSQSLRAELARKNGALEQYADEAHWYRMGGQEYSHYWAGTNGYDLARSVLNPPVPLAAAPDPEAEAERMQLDHVED